MLFEFTGWKTRIYISNYCIGKIQCFANEETKRRILDDDDDVPISNVEKQLQFQMDQLKTLDKANETPNDTEIRHFECWCFGIWIWNLSYSISKIAIDLFQKI